MDERGRLDLPKSLRERYGERFRIVQMHDGIKLIPIPEDPIEDLPAALAPSQSCPPRRSARRHGSRPSRRRSMIYADRDVLLALGKPEDGLEENAGRYLEAREGELVTSVTTFIELLLIAERYDLDRTRLATSALEVAEGTFREDIVFEVDRLIDEGFTVFDAFHAACALLGDHAVLTCETAFETLPIDRLPLEETEGG